ncbi:hypothetical protein [Pedobacter psychrodurus]|uniref:hypothetical protein n=1 Tax=Pedobacter psychrodurus TaxID=2530456 RepID=UPI00292D609E|nr:hypothetical protein [Pedobacter psychrodurus]
MKRFLSLLAIINFYSFCVYAQHFNQAIDKDSLLLTIYKKLGTVERVNEFKSYYNSADQKGQEFLLFMGSMPSSSKKELVANIDSNYRAMLDLITGYGKIVPKGYIVTIEFQPANNVISAPASVDMQIRHRNPDNFNSLETDQDWGMEFGSVKLKKMCDRLNWTEGTLKNIKTLLDRAHCVSIENDTVAEIGFSRSSMAKYSYLIFKNDLDAATIGRYNDGCSHIYYKKNIVLEFMGGAVGPQCFPKVD